MFSEDVYKHSVYRLTFKLQCTIAPKLSLRYVENVFEFFQFTITFTTIVCTVALCKSCSLNYFCKIFIAKILLL